MNLWVKMIDAISWQNYNIKMYPSLSFLCFMNSRQMLFDRSALSATDTRSQTYYHEFRDEEISSCAECTPSGSGWLQLSHKHHHHRFILQSCPHQFIQHVIEVYSAHSIAVYTIYVSRQNRELHVLKLLRHWWGIVDVLLEQIWY